MKLTRLVWLVAGIVIGGTASAQSWDASGNGMLSGSYYFRQVAWQLDNSGTGSLNDAVSLYGTISFNGSGSYSLSATEVDYSSGEYGPTTFSGTYSISASGLGFLSSPISTGDEIYGLVSNGVFIGSSTENGSGYNDLFIAAPSSSNSAVQSAFQGAYSISYLNFPSSDPTAAYDAQFQLSPGGSGQIGNVSVSGYVGTNLTSAFTTSESGVKYVVSNGAVAISFPNSNNVPITGETGQQFLYMSPDGNFVFGGSQYGFDMFVGVRNSGSTPSFNGLFYQAGVDEDESTISSGYVSPDSYYGSLLPVSGENILGHQRILSLISTGNAYDYTYGEFGTSGASDDPDTGQHYTYGAFSSGQTIRIGFGNASVAGVLGISVALAAPPASTFSGPGVYLNPTGVQNAGSFALFTTGIAPGEFILLNGTGLANTTTSSAAFPTKLGGVQVLINNNLAPIYLVSPTLLKVLVPYEVAANSFASIQVINNGVNSNSVSVFTSMTAPGVFTIPPDGLSDAAAEDPNFNIISAANPAQIGETIAVYLTGLGAVNPPIVDGGVGSSSAPYNLVSNTISVDFGGTDATSSIAFAGLTPTAIGLYQINVTVPSGATTGDIFLDIGGPDAYTSEAGIEVGAGSSIEGGSAPRVVAPNGRRIRSRRPRSVKSASQAALRRKIPGADAGTGSSAPSILKPLAP